MEPHHHTVILFGRSFAEGFRLHFRAMIARLASHETTVYIFKPFLQFVRDFMDLDTAHMIPFAHTRELPAHADVMLSIGGDGTFLEAVTYIRDTEIPVAGINSGRLGFLADIAQEEIPKALDSIFSGLFHTEKRTLLELQSNAGLFGEFNFALNEITLHKRDDSSMISIRAWIDDEFLTTYWADGLIVSTPTGSTAYSLSVGGPLVVPGASDFILAPIAPHNMTVRPLIVPDDRVLRLQTGGRGRHVLVSLDSRSVVAEAGLELTIRKAPFQIITLRLKDHSFYNTLRTKLMWGADKRN